MIAHESEEEEREPWRDNYQNALAALRMRSQNSMTMTEKQRDEMLEAAKPLMKWLAENFHPHTMAIVHAAHIELLEGIATNSTLEYVDDGASEGKSIRGGRNTNLRVLD